MIPRIEKAQHRPRERGHARSEVVQEGAGPRIAALQQDGEVSDLLRDLVRDDGERARDAQRKSNGEGGCDHHPVYEVVKRISDQKQ